MTKKSYIISNYRVSKSTYTFIHNILAGVSEKEKRFFLHLLCSHLLRLAPGEEEIVEGYDSLGLSLPSVTIKAEFRGRFPWMELEKRKLIEVSDYCDGVCRYYLVKPTLFQSILAHLEQQATAPDGSPAVNLFDGLAYSVGHALQYPPKANRPSSKLMRDAARVLHAVDCPINAEAIQAHLEKLRATKHLAYDNDRLCAQTILSGMKSSGAAYSYIPSYGPQDTGRIGENGGGLQSCTKQMKEAAFHDLPNVYNYDLRSSHAYVLLQELKRAGIDGSWVEEHVGKDVFEQRAEQLGLPKGVYKKCFFSTINGASHFWKGRKEKPGPIQEVLLKHYGQVVVLARDKFYEVVAQLKPLKAIVRMWHTWLLSEACPYRMKTQRGEHLLNEVGQKLVLDRTTPEDELPEEVGRRVNAHILQGQEAAYIHQLTLLSKEYDFLPVSNQHDGIITVGKVPEEAMKEAGRLSGFQQPFLEIKSFV